MGWILNITMLVLVNLAWANSETSSTVSPTVTATVVYSQYEEIFIILGLGGGLGILLMLLLQMAAKQTQDITDKLTEQHRKRNEKNVVDEFQETNGYSWDWVMVFKVFDEDDKFPEGQKTMKEIVTALHSAGLETQLFFSVQRDKVYCKIRVPLERLKGYADKVDYKLLMDPDELKQYCERGTAKWNPIKIVDESDELLPAYECIYMEYRKTQEGDTKNISMLYKKYSNRTNFKGIDRLKLIYGIMTAKNDPEFMGANLNITEMKDKKGIEDLFPLHDYDELVGLEKRWLKLMQWPWQQPTDDIKDYFGEKIGLYYVWLGHYTTWLMPPMLTGLGFWFAIATQGGDPNTVYLIPFSALIALWATFFLEYWKRKESETAMFWGTRGFEEQEQDRPQFFGDKKNSEITGQPETVFNPNEKMKRNLISQTFISFMILMVLTAVVSITVMKVIFNTVPSVTNTLDITLIGINIPFYSILPSVANALQIQIMNFLYGGVAQRLNEYENHRTDTEFEDSLIGKTFVFQFINSYAALFYLAFIEYHVLGGSCTGGDCINQVRNTLSTIFLIRLTSGNISEVLIPYLKFRAIKEDEAEGADPDRTLSVSEEQFLGDEYHVMLGPFDDYSEMIIQYGYSTLFIAAFPLAMMMSFINNYVEMRVDGWNLCHQCRRPEPRGQEDIGTWYSILEIMSAAAVVTNASIVCFTSTVFSEGALASGSSLKIWIFVMMEHALFGVKFVLASVVEDTPEFAEVQLARVEFLEGKVINDIADEDDDDDGGLGDNDNGFSLLVHDEDPTC